MSQNAVRAVSSRATFDHHVVLCVFGGTLIGALQGLLIGGGRWQPDVATLLLGWMALGAVHGPLTWPVLATRSWWTTSIVMDAGILVGAIAASFGTSIEAVFILPLVAMWLAAWACWRFSPRHGLTGCCVACDYDLRGLTSARCPECGTAFAKSKPATHIEWPA